MDNNGTFPKAKTFWGTVFVFNYGRAVDCKLAAELSSAYLNWCTLKVSDDKYGIKMLYRVCIKTQTKNENLKRSGWPTQACLPKTKKDLFCPLSAALIGDDPPSYWRWTILISTPVYQQTDISACSECEHTKQFTTLYRQTSHEHCDWLLCLMSAQLKHTHPRTHGAHSSSSRSRAAGGPGAPHWRPDGVDTAWPIVRTCWSVPSVAWQLHVRQASP